MIGELRDLGDAFSRLPRLCGYGGLTAVLPKCLPMERDTLDEETPVAKVVRSLDMVLFEIGRIDDVWLEMPRDVMNTSIIHEGRRRARELLDLADSYLQWVADTRLEPPAN
jgi:hypothetical protein